MVSISICGRLSLWSFGFVAVWVCGLFGLWPFRSVAVWVCGRSGLWPFLFVAVSVCGCLGFARSGLWPLWPESANRAGVDGTCRGPNASNPARGRTLLGQERPSNGRPDASQRRPGSMLCPVGLPGALSVDILALLLYWPTYAPITVRLTCTNHSAPYAPFWHVLIFYFC